MGLDKNSNGVGHWTHTTCGHLHRAGDTLTPPVFHSYNELFEFLATGTEQ